MALMIRLATREDAVQWADMLHKSVGKDYGAKEIYDLEWCAAQVAGSPDQETWVSEVSGRLEASVSILKPSAGNTNPILYLGRQLTRPESAQSGSAEALLRKMVSLGVDSRRTIVSLVSTLDRPAQALHENLGFLCAGWQPFKHSLPRRLGMLFYVKPDDFALGRRLKIHEASTHVAEIAVKVLGRLHVRDPIQVRESLSGYPLQAEADVAETGLADFESGRTQSQGANAPPEVSSGYNIGVGHLRLARSEPPRAFVASRGGRALAGVTYFFDPLDRCVRFPAAFASDEASLGALWQRAIKTAQDQYNPIYLEIDVLANATRLLKTAEQLGFVPVAYLPAFFSCNDAMVDVVKMVKLNMAYASEAGEFTQHAREIVELMDRMFNDQKTGVAIINLLRALPIFNGLGDGELRKISRLFTQKLYRAGERIFNKGDVGEEAYIVMRGQIDICLEEKQDPIARVSNGKIFGELAFLDGAPRNALAVASQPSILLVVRRAAMNDLIEREPHLGMLVMRNIAIDLSTKLRQANLSIAAQKK
jgi:hypothetical protein